MSRSSNLKMGAILSYLGICVNIVAGLIYTPWLIKSIGQSDYGLYVLATTFIGYFFIDFGLGNSISRFISKYRLEDDQQTEQNFLGIIYKLYMVISAIIFVILLVVYVFIDGIFLQLTVAELDRFRIVYVIAGLFSIISFPFNTLNGILIAYEQYVPLKLAGILQKILLITLMVILLSLGKGLYALVAVNAVTGFTAIIYKLIVVKRNTNIRINWRYYNKSLLKVILSFSIWITIIGLAQQMIVNLPPTLLAIISGTTAITIYSIGRIIQSYVWTFADALNGLFMPKVTQINRLENAIDKTNELMVTIGRIQLFIIGLVVSGYISFGHEFTRIWIGKAFGESYWVAVLLIIPYLVTLTQEIANVKLYVVNEIKYRAILYICAFITSIFINLLLVPRYGAIGAAIGIFIAFILFNIVGINIVYKRILKIDILGFFKKCHLKLLPPIMVCTLLGISSRLVYVADTWGQLAAKAFIYTLVYTTVMWMTAMNFGEKALCLSLVNGITLKLKKLSNRHIH
jgi:O-antigen/teichoic acid export membrane protein